MSKIMTDATKPAKFKKIFSVHQQVQVHANIITKFRVWYTIMHLSMKIKTGVDFRFHFIRHIQCSSIFNGKITCILMSLHRIMLFLIL